MDMTPKEKNRLAELLAHVDQLREDNHDEYRKLLSSCEGVRSTQVAAVLHALIIGKVI